MRHRRKFTVASLLACAAPIAVGQNSEPEFELRLTDSDAMRTVDLNSRWDDPVQIQMYLLTDSSRFANGEWLGLLRGRDFANLPTRIDGSKGSGLSAFIYKPGCAVQLVRVDDIEHAPQTLQVPCNPRNPVTVNVKIGSLIAPEEAI